MMFQHAREEVVSTCLTLADRGYLAGTGGNVALRADQEHFLVTPSGMDYYTMGPADICVIRLQDKALVEGDSMPSVEAGLHANVLNARPDCRASIHTHQPIASAYTLLAIPLVVEDVAHRLTIGAEIPCVAYAPSGTGLLAKKVGKAFNEFTHTCLMRNHGVVCVGEDVDEAIERVATLEAACAAFFLNFQKRGKTGLGRNSELIRKTLIAELNSHQAEPAR